MLSLYLEIIVFAIFHTSIFNFGFVAPQDKRGKNKLNDIFYRFNFTVAIFGNIQQSFSGQL